MSTDGLFHLIEDAHAILVHRGVYKQTPLYERHGLLFAKFGAGFILLSGAGGTSHPDARLEQIIHDGTLPLSTNSLGRITLDSGGGRLAIEHSGSIASNRPARTLSPSGGVESEAVGTVTQEPDA